MSPEEQGDKNHFVHGPGRVASPQIVEIAPLTVSGLLDRRHPCNKEAALSLTFYLAFFLDSKSRLLKLSDLFSAVQIRIPLPCNKGKEGLSLFPRSGAWQPFGVTGNTMPIIRVFVLTDVDSFQDTHLLHPRRASV